MLNRYILKFENVFKRQKLTFFTYSIYSYKYFKISCHKYGMLYVLYY